MFKIGIDVSLYFFVEIIVVPEMETVRPSQPADTCLNAIYVYCKPEGSVVHLDVVRRCQHIQLGTFDIGTPYIWGF